MVSEVDVSYLEIILLSRKENWGVKVNPFNERELALAYQKHRPGNYKMLHLLHSLVLEFATAEDRLIWTLQHG